MKPFLSRVRGGVPAFVDAFLEHDLLTYASAISFQIFSAIVPFLAFAFALMGFLSLEEIWLEDLGPELRPQVSKAAFAVVDDAALTVLRSKQVFWLSAGLLIAIWQISGGVRAVMGALNKLYRVEQERTWGQRMLISFALSIAIGTLFLLAGAVVALGPLLYGDYGTLADIGFFLVRWGVAAGLFLVCVALLLRFAPEQHQPIHWVSFGSVLIIAAWVLASVGFGIYLTLIADYGSVFGAFATVVILIGYIYLSVLVFLGGVQVDALVREELASQV